MLDNLRLSYDSLKVYATPRRLVLYAHHVAPNQPNVESTVKGPPARAAFDADGNPTKAAMGFARGKGIDVADLRRAEIDGGEYVVATVREEGRSALEVLAEALPEFIAGIKFNKSMRWNASGIAFSRPIRWFVALFGETVIPFKYADTPSGNTTRGLRPYDSPELTIANPAAYFKAMGQQGIILDKDERRTLIREQVKRLADKVGGHIPDDEKLLAEVANLVERPTALRGSFRRKTPPAPA